MALSAEAIIAIISLFVTLGPVLTIVIKLRLNRQRGGRQTRSMATTWRGLEPDIEPFYPMHRGTYLPQPIRGFKYTYHRQIPHPEPSHFQQCLKKHISDSTVYPSTLR